MAGSPGSAPEIWVGKPIQGTAGHHARDLRPALVERPFIQLDLQGFALLHFSPLKSASIMSGVNNMSSLLGPPDVY